MVWRKDTWLMADGDRVYSYVHQNQKNSILKIIIGSVDLKPSGYACGYQPVHFHVDFLSNQQRINFSCKLANAKVIESAFSDDNFSLYGNPKEMRTKVLFFLRMLIKEDAQVLEIRDEICAYFRIPTLNDIKRKPICEAIQFVLDAQKEKNYYLAEQLLFYYWESHEASLTDIYKLIENIDEANPCYAEAQDLAVKVLTLQVPSPFSNAFFNEELYYQNLELRFRHAQKGTSQRITDDLYSMLCNDSINMSTIENIKGDAETLFKLAKKMREQMIDKEQLAMPVKPTQAEANNSVSVVPFSLFTESNTKESTKIKGDEVVSILPTRMVEL
jgi:hypothetical protein